MRPRRDKRGGTPPIQAAAALPDQHVLWKAASCITTAQNVAVQGPPR